MTWIDHTKIFGAGKNYGIGESVFYDMNCPLRIRRTERPLLEKFSCPYPAMANEKSLRSVKTRPQASTKNLQKSSLCRREIDKRRNITSQRLSVLCANANLYQDRTNLSSRQFPIKCSHTFSNPKSTKDASIYYNESSQHHNKLLKGNYSHDKFDCSNCLATEDLQARKDKILQNNRVKSEDFLIDLRALDSYPDKIESTEIFNPAVKEVKEEVNLMEIDRRNLMIHENDPIASLVPEDLRALEKKLLNTNRVKPEDFLMDLKDLESFLDKMETAEIFNPDLKEVSEDENSLGIEPPDPVIKTFQPNSNENKDTEKSMEKEEPVSQSIQCINKIEDSVYRIGDHVLLKCSETLAKWQRGVVTAISESDICDVQTMDGKTHKLNVDQLFKTRIPGEKAAEIYSIDIEVEDVHEHFTRHLVIPPPEEWADIIGI